jgi:hypothetical protein
MENVLTKTREENKMENTKAILKGIQNALNGELIQSKLGSEFEKMNPDTKAQFMMFMLNQLASENPDIMNLLAKDSYELLNA